MTLALLGHWLRRYRWLLALSGFLLACFPFFFLRVFLGDERIQALVTMIRNLPGPWAAALGGDRIDLEDPHGIAAIVYVHPFTLVVGSVLPITFAVRTLAGDVESGRMELILSRPVRRGALVDHALLASLGGALLLGLSIWAGTCLAVLVSRDGAGFPYGKFLGLGLEAAALYLSIAGMALVFSAWKARQGPAAAWCGMTVLVMWLVEFFAEHFEWLRFVEPLGLFEYYNPHEALRQGGWLPGDLAVLLGVAMAGYLFSRAVFSRRDVLPL